MVKYVQEKTGEVAVAAEFDEKFKTYLLTLEDGKTISRSASTFKRWWKKVKEEDVAAPVVEQQEEEKDGDGTPHKEVMQEIIKGAEAGAKKGKVATTPLDYFDELAQSINMPYYTLAAYPMERYYKYDGGKVKAKVNFCKSGDFTLWLKSSDLEESVARELEILERWNYNRRLIVKVKGNMEEFHKNFENILTLIIKSLKEDK